MLRLNRNELPRESNWSRFQRRAPHGTAETTHGECTSTQWVPTHLCSVDVWPSTAHRTALHVLQSSKIATDVNHSFRKATCVPHLTTDAVTRSSTAAVEPPRILGGSGGATNLGYIWRGGGYNNLQTLITDSTAEKIEMWKFRTIHLLILHQYVSQWGLITDMLGA